MRGLKGSSTVPTPRLNRQLGWGASRIHGELLMLGFEVAQSTVSAKYMMRPSRPRSQTWKTFSQNHAEAIAAIDMCVVPTLIYDPLNDILKGVYFQAVLQQKFDVYFTRAK
jgi:hypothetical protein